jgi:hypothetical protein
MKSKYWYAEPMEGRRRKHKKEHALEEEQNLILLFLSS